MWNAERRLAYLTKTIRREYTQLRRMIYRDARIARRKKDKLRLKHFQPTAKDRWILIALIIIMILAMIIGGWLAFNFKGKTIEI